MTLDTSHYRKLRGLNFGQFSSGLSDARFLYQMVASTWITPGCVRLLKIRERFRTAWVIRYGVEPLANPAMAALRRRSTLRDERITAYGARLAISPRFGSHFGIS
jgi:hypothetical protein